MTIDTRAAVPATVGLFRVVNLHHNLVILFLILVKIWSYIHGERCIAIVMLSGFLSINEYFGFLIHTLEMQFYQFALRGLECLAVFALASLEPSAASTSCSLSRIGTFEDIPIVRQIYTDGLTLVGKVPAVVK